MSKELATHWIDFLIPLLCIKNQWNDRVIFPHEPDAIGPHQSACMIEQFWAIEQGLAERPEQKERSEG